MRPPEKQHRFLPPPPSPLFAFGFAALLCAAACTTTHTVRTVGKGNFGVEGSFGGPLLTNLGGPIPAPNLYVGGRYGVRDDLDVSAAYNLTAPVIPGLPVALILGGRYVPIQPGLRAQAETRDRGWSLASGLDLHILTDFETGFTAIPAVDLASGYRLKWFNPFVGVQAALHLYRPFGDTHPVMLSPYVGAEFLLPRDTAISVRVTFFDVTYNYWGSQVDWVSLSEDDEARKARGIVGLTLGFSWDLFGDDDVETQSTQEAL